MSESEKYLTGKLLIAMPGMGDPRFDRSVVFLVAHNDEGAMGFIINKPADDVTLSDLLEHMEIESAPNATPVFFGGPVENGRGFVIHSADYEGNESTLEIPGGYGMTATLDILEDIAKRRGPRKSMLALGYAGWSDGQLEEEIAANGWLICDATDALVFGPDHDAKWVAAMRTLGIDPLMLSAEGGRA
ncbi:MAG: YqgE/AlgH family protein [Shimia sp.]